MADAVGWTKRPTAEIVPALARVAGARPAVEALAESMAGVGQDRMQAGRIWTDRTSYARGSLFGRAEGTTIILGTTNDEYGVHLEVGTVHMAPRPIIVPTANELAPEYYTAAAQVVLGVIAGRGAF